MKKSLRKQSGVTLVVALIMLVLVTLLVVTSLNLGKSSLQTVGNMQQRNEAFNAAQETMEEIISSTRLFNTPGAVIAAPCNGVANTKCIDTNGDGVADVTIAITPNPACIKTRTIKTSELDLSNSEDAGCSVGGGGGFGIAGAVTGNSLCASNLWNIRAVATDAITQAQVIVTQGVSVRADTDTIATSCPP